MQAAATKSVLKELKSLQREPIDQVVVLPSETPATLEAVLFGQAGTPFEGGQFKVRLQLGAEYPQAPPKGWFLSKIFHPNVGPDGAICVNTLKKDWAPNLGLRHVLITIKCLLVAPNAESALNEEAGKLLLEDYDEYAKTAKLWTSIHASKSLVDVAPPADENENAGPSHEEGKKPKLVENKKKKKTLKRL